MNAEERPPNFDRIARLYRWLEYASFGRALERCRFMQLPRLAAARHLLVLGDGDGRFVARMLADNPATTADVVDGSAAMLALTRTRLQALGANGRVQLHCADSRAFRPEPTTCYDVVVTHFFLDCLSEDEIAALSERLLPQLAPDAAWVVSEFDVPQRGVMRWCGRVLIRGLYLAFAWMTGLRVRKLPEYRPILAAAGFGCVQHSVLLGGILRSELWRRQDERRQQ